MNYLKIVLLVAFEPKSNFLSFVQEIKQAGFEVLVINDGSPVSFDSIFLEVSKMVKVLKHEFNRGKGASIKTGLEYIQTYCKENYVVVTMDSGGDYTLEDVEQISKEAIINTNSLLLGSRRRKNTSIVNNIGKEVMRFAYQKKTGLDIYDTQANLRAFTNFLTPFLLSVKGNRFNYEMNVLLSCAEKKINIKEIALVNKEVEEIVKEEHQEEVIPEREIFKTVCFSIFGIGIDFCLFLILSLFSKNGLLSLVFARILSALFIFNKEKPQMIQKMFDSSKISTYYFLFVGGQLVCSVLLFLLLNSALHLPLLFAKIVTEVAMYAVCLGRKMV